MCLNKNAGPVEPEPPALQQPLCASSGCKMPATMGFQRNNAPMQSTSIFFALHLSLAHCATLPRAWRKLSFFHCPSTQSQRVRLTFLPVCLFATSTICHHSAQSPSSSDHQASLQCKSVLRRAMGSTGARIKKKKNDEFS